MVVATPANPTTIKISRDKHDPREDHKSSLYPIVVEIIFGEHINYLSIASRKEISLPLQRRAYALVHYLIESGSSP